MRSILRIGALPLALLFAVGACQRPVEVYSEPAVAAVTPQPVVVTPVNGAVPAQTEIQARLDQRLGTAENEVNDRFTMTLPAPIVDTQNRTLVPAGAQISGRITALRESLDFATPAIIRLELQNISWAGTNVPLHAEVTASEPRRTGRTTEDAIRGAAAGAAAGAVIGAVIRRDVQGALAGAAIGAGAGTVISLGTSNQQAYLEEGSMMTLRLTEPLPTRR